MHGCCASCISCCRYFLKEDIWAGWRCLCVPVLVLRLQALICHLPFALHPAVLTACRAFAEQRAAALGQTLEGVLSTEPEGLGSDPEARRCVLAALTALPGSLELLEQAGLGSGLPLLPPRKTC